MYYWWLMIPALLLSLWAQAKVKGTFSKYSKVRSRNGYTGEMTAREFLDDADLHDIDIVAGKGMLTDHYNPKKRLVNLSEAVHSHNSIAAIGVAAHETGHALQDRDGYGPLRLRTYLVPVANIGSMAGPYIVIFGLIFSVGFLIELGIVLFAAAVLFYLITLPVELNASKRAMELLENKGILEREELVGAKKVLSAAAFTYVAAAISAILTLLRLVLLSRNRR